MVDVITTLIVDDEPTIRDLMRLLIEAEGEDLQVVGEAADGETAVDAAQKLQPRVVILDVLMPGMDGFETASQILALNPEQRIIFFSAALAPTEEQRALSLGVRACVDKLSVNEIPDVIRQVASAA